MSLIKLEYCVGTAPQICICFCQYDFIDSLQYSLADLANLWFGGIYKSTGWVVGVIISHIQPVAVPIIAAH